MMQLVKAEHNGNEEMYQQFSDESDESDVKQEKIQSNKIKKQDSI